jgi:GrpB-like predicted nucleotidyltransferase (UPF0157 family)
MRLMVHNEQWRQEFLQAKSMLLWSTEGWLSDVHHIGSTALEDIIAQPIIDTLAVMRDLQGLNEAAKLVEGINYARLAAPAWCQEELVAYLAKPRVGEPTHTVLIVKEGSPLCNRVLGVQARLANSLFDRQALETLKRDHFIPGCAADARYEAAKTEFFENLARSIE